MKLILLFLLLVSCIVYPTSCSKTGGIPPPPPPDPCSFAAIDLSGSVTNPSVSGAADGSIAALATGGSGFMYSISGGSFQSSGVFKNLVAGNYRITAKNSDGCSGSLSFVLTNPVASCAGVNIVVTSVAGNNVLCEPATASVMIAASGGVSPYSYSLNGSVFQSQPVFSNTASGNYIITVKDANGCMGSASTTVSNAAAGPFYLQVKALIQSKCLYCHNNINAGGGVSYSDDCSIVAGKSGIKARAVDGIPSAMPQSGLLPAAERQKILDWINAGGRYTD